MNAHEIIDRVKWEDFSSPSKKWAMEIPLLLHKLISVDNPNEHRYDIQCLRNHIAHQTGIYQTTVATLPVLLELLNLSEVVNKRWVLEALWAIRTDNIKYMDFYTEDKRSLIKNVYNTMFDNIDRILPFLEHEDGYCRAFAARILLHLSYHPQVIFPYIWSYLKREKDDETIIMATNELDFIFKNNPHITPLMISTTLDILKLIMVSSNVYVRCYMALKHIQIHPSPIGGNIENVIIECIQQIPNVDAAELPEFGSEFSFSAVTTSIYVALYDIPPAEKMNFLQKCTFVTTGDMKTFFEKLLREAQKLSENASTWKN